MPADNFKKIESKLIDLSHNDVKCGYEMFHAIGLALKNIESIIFNVT